MGKDGVKAAQEGMREITFAAIASSVAVIAIFLTIALMEGVIGRSFFQLGETLSASVPVSLMDAATITPMRASQMLVRMIREPRIVKVCGQSLPLDNRPDRTSFATCLIQYSPG